MGSRLKSFSRRLGFIATFFLATLEVDAVTLQIRHLFGERPLRLGELETVSAGSPMMSVTRFDYLLSDFRWVKFDGSESPLSPQVAYISVGSDRTFLTLTPAPLGTSAALRFRVGLPPHLNHANPVQFAALDPLNPSVNGLHWGWQGGYVFMALEGNWRRSDGSLDGYSFHLATDALVMPIEIPIREGTDVSVVIPLVLDIARIFGAVKKLPLDIGHTSTHSRTNDALASLMAANVARAFRWDHSPAAVAAVAAVPALKIEIGPNATPYPFTFSRLFPVPALPRDNPLTEEGVRLGDRLFGENLLSINGSQSCASCHQASSAFTDAGRRTSRGAEGIAGARNTQSLENIAWQTTFFWDGRTASLREQVLQPIGNPIEMHESLTNVVSKLERAGYGPAFEAAFGTSLITVDRLSRALEQYLLTRVSGDSKFDRAARGEEILTSEEQRGFELFQTEYDPRHEQFGADCFHCHGGTFFSDFAFHNNGLDQAESLRDTGRAAITGRSSDRGRFKTPSLRNVAITGPYMHDGRFASLEEVVAHYSTGVQRSPTLDPNLAKHPANGISLCSADQRALVAFLKTLTEVSLVNSEKPKRRQP